MRQSPPGGGINVVPAEAENGAPPGWGEGVPLAEEGVGFFGELGLAALLVCVLLILFDGCGTTLQKELDILEVALAASIEQRGVSMVVCFLLIGTTVEQEPHHLEMALGFSTRWLQLCLRVDDDVFIGRCFCVK